jgi:hypothetical protein
VPLERGHLRDEPHALAQVGLLGFAVVVEVHDAAPDDVHERLVRLGRRETRAQAVEVLVEGAPDDVVLRLEVAEQRAAPDAQLRGDVVERRALESTVDEQAQARARDLVARRRPGASWSSL